MSSSCSFGLECLEQRRLLSAVVDLRLVGGGKTATVSTVGQFIKMEAWMTVTGADATLSNEGLQSLIGSFLSKNVNGGAASGSLSFNLVAPFNGSYSRRGAGDDLDGDGDQDWGSNSDEADPNYFLARANEMQTTGTVSGKSVSFKFGTLSFYVQSLRSGTRTEINYRPRPIFAGYPTAAWMEDGIRHGGDYGPQLAAPVVLTRALANAAPTASLGAANITTGGGATSHTFTVQYADETAINVASIDNADVRVTGPNGYSQLATRQFVTGTGNGSPRTATYKITAPGGTWNSADNGTYTVTMQAAQVSDTSGKFVPAGTLGLFTTNISRYGSVSGYVFRDGDGDGEHDYYDSALTNPWRIFIDADKDGVFDATERSVYMPSGGSVYWFANLLPGTYRVRMIPISGNRFTLPTSGYYDVTINENTVTGKHFGVTTNVLIRGSVFNDSNLDTFRNTGEVGLSGWFVYIDANKNGIFDGNDDFDYTDSSGNFRMTTHPAGTYVIRIVQQSGWARTTPSSRTVTLGSGGTSAQLLFGQRRIV
jgi:hypothetical protein